MSSTPSNAIMAGDLAARSIRFFCARSPVALAFWPERDLASVGNSSGGRCFIQVKSPMDI